MEAPIAAHLYTVSTTPAGPVVPRWVRRHASDLGLAESWLRDAIYAQPQLVIDCCAEAGLTDEEWYAWGREVRIGSTGRVDVLLVSSMGRIGVVETKLWGNPENRRKVVAQTLDYVVALTGGDRTSLELPPLPQGVDPEDVDQGLRRGDFLVVIAADRLDDRAVRLGDALMGKHILNSWELAMLDMAVFVQPGTSHVDDVLIVPNLRGVVTYELRQIVRIDLPTTPAGAPTITVKHVTEVATPKEKREDNISLMARLLIAGTSEEEILDTYAARYSPQGGHKADPRWIANRVAVYRKLAMQRPEVAQAVAALAAKPPAPTP